MHTRIGVVPDALIPEFSKLTMEVSGLEGLELRASCIAMMPACPPVPDRTGMKKSGRERPSRFFKVKRDKK